MPSPSRPRIRADEQPALPGKPDRVAAGGDDQRRLRGGGRARARRRRPPARARAVRRARVEAPPRRERVRVVGLARCAEPLEPVERLVEPLPDEPLERLVAAGTLAPELLEVAVAPDRRRSRAASSRPARSPFSSTRTSTPSSRSAGRGDEPRHPRSENGDQRSEKLALCSTYSSLTRSGPQTNTAKVFAASTTSATSTPSSCAGAASSTRTPRWLSSGRSRLAAVALDSSRNAPPTSTRRGRPSARTRSRSHSRAARLGIRRAQRDVVEVVLDSVSASTSVSVSPSPSSNLSAAGGREHAKPDPCRSAPGSRGPSASNSVSFPRRASAADEREPVGPLDDVHAELRDGEIGDRRRAPRPRARRGRARSGACRPG